MKSGWEVKTLLGLAILFTIKFTQPLLFPILFAFILFLLINPVLDWLVFFKIPRVVAAAFIVCALLGIISTGVTFLLQPASQWIDKAPSNFSIIEHKFSFVRHSLTNINRVAETAQNLTQSKEKIKVTTEGTSLSMSLFDLTSSIVILIVMILLFLFFLLIYCKPLLHSLDRVFFRRKKTFEEHFFISLQNKVSSYMFTFTLICFGLGVIMAFVFWMLDLPNPILWGAMVMVLTFIPYLGHLIGITIILLVSIITFDSYTQMFAPPAIYFLVTIIEGQLVTPILLGSRLDLNPLIIFTSIFLWDWLWGITGVLISVPLLLTIKLIFEQIPNLKKYRPIIEQ